MRPYRAIPIDGKDFVYGWHIELEDEHYIIPDTASICYGVTIGTSHYDFIEGFIKVIPETVGQQIGKKDKNNKEIYEGDEVSSGFWEGVVEFTKGAFNIIRVGCSSSSNFDVVEVIGNIHQPELIKK